MILHLHSVASARWQYASQAPQAYQRNQPLGQVQVL